MNKKLFLVRDANDRDLTSLYVATTGLIMASFAEGFGLPIIEAFQRGANVACSDIPVFREIAGEHASYFDPHDSDSLADAVRSLSEMGEARKRQVYLSPGNVSWAESTQQLLSKVIKMAENS